MRVDASARSISILILLTASGAAYGLDQAEIRSAVATGDYTWNSQNFPGFYYDANGDLGTEKLNATITEGCILNGDYFPYGLEYTTNAQTKRFDHAPWGAYKVIGFFGKPHFAGYVKDANLREDDQVMLKESEDTDLLSIPQLREVLIDNDTEITMASHMPLRLKEGYLLEIKSIDKTNENLYLELTKDGQIVDSKRISPSKSGATESEKTYYYKVASGSRKIVIIAVSFKNAFRGADQIVATVSGLWQLSETPLDVSPGSVFDKMRVATVDTTNDQIFLNNKDYRIFLDKGKDLSLMSDIGIRTANSNTTRYYIYKPINKPGTYEIRGSVAEDSDFTWSAQNFQGFYYDPDEDLGTETLRTTITEGNTLSGDAPYGLIYQTMAQPSAFKFRDWGKYNIIGFLGKGYFAGYAPEPDSDPSQQILRSNSKSPNLLNSEGLSEILFDDNREQTILKGGSLKLEQGYELLVKGISQDGQTYLELLKDGKTIDSKILAPSADGATMADKTYWYAKAFGGSNIVTLAVHFKNVYRDEDMAAATIDGIWQISDQFMPIKVGSQYGLMNVASYGADSLTMDNKDNAIRLSRNNDISIMPGLNIRVADNDTLRYYPYTTVTVNGSTIEAVPEGTGLQNETLGIMPETYSIERSQDNLTAANADNGDTTVKHGENTSKLIDPGI